MGIVPETGRLHDPAGIQHHDRPCEGLTHPSQHAALRIRQVEVSPFKQRVAHADRVAGHRFLPCNLRLRVFPVPSLSGKPAEGDNRRVGERPGFTKELFGHRRLRHHARNPVRCVLFIHILPVILHRSLIDRLRSDDLRKSVIQVPDIGNRHVPAASAALDIIDCGLAKQRHSAPPGKRKHIPFILQQHHTFAGGSPGQRDMFLSRSNTAAVLSEGQSGQIT